MYSCPEGPAAIPHAVGLLVLSGMGRIDLRKRGVARTGELGHRLSRSLRQGRWNWRGGGDPFAGMLARPLDQIKLILVLARRSLVKNGPTMGAVRI